MKIGKKQYNELGLELGRNEGIEINKQGKRLILL